LKKLAALLLVLSSAASSAPPVNGEGRFGDWFKSLRNDQGQSCCDLSDCRITKQRYSPNGYQALTETGEWVDIPPDKILKRDNPIGEPVMCYLPARGVMCFIRGFEA